jgi:uncharacterized protein YciI
MHALVLMAPGETRPDSGLQADHEQFIDRLAKENKVILGGVLEPPAANFVGAYVVNCDSLDEARRIAASDPLARANAIRCEITEWELVGINPKAVDRDALLYPDMG